MPLKKKLYNLLKWSQKYTKTDMVYVARGGFWFTLGQAITFLSGFLLTWVFANFVDKDVYGTYKFVISIASILSIATLGGMNTALLRAVARGKEGSFITILKTKLKWGVLSALGSFALSGYYFYKGNITLTLSFLLIAAFIPLMNAFSIYESFWAGKKRFDTENKYKAFIHIASSLVVIGTIFLTKNVFLILLSYFLSWSFLGFILVILTIKKTGLREQKDKEALRYGKHLSLMDVLGTVNSHLDKILLWHFLGASQVAIYAIAIALPSTIKGCLKVISGLAMPKLAERAPGELKKSVPRKTLLLFLIAIPLSIVYILFAPLLFRVFFPQYQEFVFLSQVYAVILCFFPRVLFGTSLTAQMKTKSLYKISFILSPIYIILLFVLVPLFGIMGAILATLITELITFLLQLFFFKKM